MDLFRTTSILAFMLFALIGPDLPAQVPAPATGIQQPQSPRFQGIPGPPQTRVPQPSGLGPGNPGQQGGQPPVTFPPQHRPALQPGSPRSAGGYHPEPDFDVKSNYIDPFRARRDDDRITAIASTLREVYETESRISYDLPARTTGTAHYRAAAQEIRAMLDGKHPCDLKRAVFLVENAWNDNQGDYREFCNRISDMADACRHLINSSGKHDNQTRNMAVFDFLTDTTRVSTSQGMQTNLPVRYDFDDFMGREDWTKMFVTKLVRTGSGQCHSMPLLYLILAGEVGADARLAFGPSHIYIKFPDASGKLRNLELTNGRMTTDAWIVGSGYVKAEAVRHGIYFDTLTTRQTIALCLFDLAKGYAIRFSMDRFVLDAVNAGLEVHPASIYGLMLKSDFYTLWCQYAVREAGNPSLREVQSRHPKINAIHSQMLRI